MAKNRFLVDFLFGAKMGKGFNKTIDSVNKRISGVAKTVIGLGSAYLGGKALKDLGMSALEGASSLEGYRNTLNVVQKDQMTAAKTMAWAVDFANRTPFETDSVVEASVRLESYGIVAQDVMTRIGDMAGVMNKPLMQAVEAVADAQTGELERLKEFGITKTMIAQKANEMFRGQTIINNKGQIVDQKKFNEALFSLMEDRFKGGMDIQAKSYKGLLSTISGVWKTGLANIAGISSTGEIVSGSLFDTAKEGLSWVSEKMQGMAADGTFEKIGKKVGNLLSTGIKYGKKGLAFLSQIKSKVDNSLGSIMRNLKPMAPTFERIIGKAKTLGRYLTDGFTRAGPKVQTIAEKYIPVAVENIAKLTEKAIDFATFIAGHWDTIGPIVQSVAAAFIAFKVGTGISNAINGVKGLANVLKGLQGLGFLAKLKGLSGAFPALGGAVKLFANPWVLAIAAVVGAMVLIYKNADKIKAAFNNLGDWIIAKVKPGVDWLNGIADGITQRFQDAVGFVKRFGSSFVEAFKMMGNDIKVLFTGIWEGLKSGFKGFINFFISGVNSIISGANSLSFQVPDWVPGVGGKTLGLNIPTIPMLANGGIATKPTLAMVGEGGENEAIMPLSRLQALIEAILRKKPPDPSDPKGGGKVVYQYNPTVIVQGNADAGQIKAILDDERRKFERWAKEREEYDRRTRIKPKLT